ncbi:MAG: hypothetical protein ACJ8C4_06610 [Gemmataceae bacterium]
MMFFDLFRRHRDAAPLPPGESDVLGAADEFLRKEKLIDRLAFLQPEVRQAAKDAALNRFLDVLFSHLRS